MYSTPGISLSSRSMGWVTLCSTSSADAPGISTKTSNIGTTIWGSSSRGSCHRVSRPSRMAPARNSGVSLESMKAWATRPAMPSCPSFIGHCHQHVFLQDGIRLHDDLLLVAQTGKDLDAIVSTRSESHQTKTRAAFLDDPDHVQLTPAEQRGRGNSHLLGLSHRKLRAHEHSRRQPGILDFVGEVDFDEEGSRAGVDCRNDLAHPTANRLRTSLQLQVGEAPHV